MDYGRAHARWEYTGESYHQGRASADGTDVTLTLTTDMWLGFEGGQASTRTLLKEGDVRFVALSWGGAVPPTTFDDAYRRQVWTAHHWQHWLARGDFPDHPWRGHLQRSALTLKGLTYAPTGAVCAAGTTSLPETPGGSRNYDYRYAWIRDQCFAGQAASSAGMMDLLDSAVSFTSERLLADGNHIKPAYTVLGADAAGSVTLDCECRFIGAGAVGKPLDAVTEILRETGRLIFLRGLVEQDGVLVASYSGTIRKPSRR